MIILMQKSGVYAIINTINGHQYIGSSSNLHKRYCKHIWELNKNRHHSERLQRAWSKYGEKNFNFIVLEYCLISDLIQREQFYIDRLHPEYNIAPIAGTTLGRKTSDKTKALQSKAMKGRPSPLKGRKLRQETKDKLSAARKGCIFSDEWRRNISLSLIGQKRAAGKRSDEFRQKCRERNLGKKLSEEHKQNIGNALRGRKRKPHSDETKAKLRALALNRIQSEETKKKRSDSMKRNWAKRKDNAQ